MVGRVWHGVRDWLNRRPAVLPLLVLGAILIAVAAGPEPTEASWTGLPDGDLIRWVLVGIVLSLAAVGLALLLAVRTVSTPGEAKRRSWVATLIATLFLVGLFSLIDFETTLPPPEEPVPPPDLTPGPTGPQLDPGPGFEAGDATALLIILVVAVALAIWTRRSIITPEADEEAEVASPLDASLGRAEGHLLGSNDPREAVMLAYLDLERALASLEVPRRDAETPNEHLDRALRSLGITDGNQAEPLRDLASLYAKARYSDHEITRAEQQQAGASLGRARRRLAGAG